MTPADVTLSLRAAATCDRLGIDEREVRRARAGTASEREQPRWLVVYGELADGRAIVMNCRHDRPWHVDAVRLGPEALDAAAPEAARAHKRKGP